MQGYILNTVMAMIHSTCDWYNSCSYIRLTYLLGALVSKLRLFAYLQSGKDEMTRCNAMIRECCHLRAMVTMAIHFPWS